MLGPISALDTSRRYDHVMSHVNHVIPVARVMVSNMIHNGYFKNLTGRYSFHGDLVKIMLVTKVTIREMIQ